MSDNVSQADMDRAADFLEAWEPGPEMTVVKLARAFRDHRLPMQEALKECRGVLSSIPAPHSHPLWIRMCNAIRQAEAALNQEETP